MRTSLIEKLVVNGCTDLILPPPLEIEAVALDHFQAEVPLLLLVIFAMQHFIADGVGFGRDRFHQSDQIGLDRIEDGLHLAPSSCPARTDPAGRRRVRSV